MATTKRGRQIPPELLEGYVAIQVQLPPMAAAQLRRAIAKMSERELGGPDVLTRTRYFLGVAQKLIKEEGISEAEITEEEIRELKVQRGKGRD